MKEQQFRIPDTPVCKVCTTFWSDVCQACMDNGGDHFRLKKGTTLADLPRFPTREFMEELPFGFRQVLVAVYLEKIVEFLNG